MTGANKFYSLQGLLLVAIFLIVIVSGISLLRPYRIDLTEDKLFTLSAGTRNLLARLEGEPIQLTLYYSDKVTEDLPSLRAYARRVKETLQEFELQSDGKVTLQIIDPEPFSEQEDEAAAYGLQGVPTTANDTIYFGLVGTKQIGSHVDEAESTEISEDESGSALKTEIIEFFNPQKEDALEYDISQLVYRLHRNKNFVVGVISDIPVFQHRNMRSGQINRPKIILEQLRQLFDVKRVYDSNINEIDEEIDLLMVIHPHLWSQSTLYAIDQFVLRGGKLLAFMDPKAEMDQSEQTMFGAEGSETQSSSLEQLLTAWGVEYDPKQILLDYQFAHSIPVTQYGQAMPHLGVIGVRDMGLNRDETMTAEIDVVNMASSGVLAPLAMEQDKLDQDGGSTLRFTPLMQSSGQQQLISLEAYNKASNHKELLEQFSPEPGSPHTLAAFISGHALSAFPEGKPLAGETNMLEAEAAETEETETEQDDPGSDDQPKSVHLNESDNEIAVVLFADTDLLDDRMWVRVNDFYGQLVIQPWASNSDLIMNILERLSGSVDLINVRSRGSYNRPFERVNELERQASDRLRQEEEILQNKLMETEERLFELNKSNENTVAGQLAELTDEQKKEIDKFQKERLEIRKKLREVQHQLNRDIEQLGSRLKMINMLAVPILLGFILILSTVIKRHRQRPI